MSLYFLRIVEVTVNYKDNLILFSKLTRKIEREMAGVVRGGGGRERDREGERERLSILQICIL